MATGVIPDSTPSHSHAAPGSDTQVTFNDGGIHAADAGFTYNKTTDLITLAGLAGTGSRVVEASSTGVLSATAGRSLVYLSKTVPSAVVTHSVDNVFTSTYDNYLVVMRFSESAANTGMTWRLRVGGVDSTSALYYTANMLLSAGGVIAQEVAAAASAWTIHGAGGVGITFSDVAMSVTLFGPNLANETLMQGGFAGRFSSPGLHNRQTSGLYEATTQYDGFSLIVGSGTITGEVWVFGIREV